MAKRNAVREQLKEVASRLTAVNAAETPPTTAASTRAATMAAMSPEGKAAKAKIAKLSTVLNGMPEDDEDFATERAALVAKIKELQGTLVDTMPIGARIDATRGLLTRAQKRAADAQHALELALRTVETANSEVDKAAKELEDLEGALARSPPAPSATEGGTTQADALIPVLSSLLERLRQNPMVDPALVELAEANSTQLLEGFRHTLAAAETALEHPTSPTLPCRITSRITTKRPAAPVQPSAVSPEVGPANAVRVRVTGKKPKKVLGDYFLKGSIKRTATCATMSGAKFFPCEAPEGTNEA